MSVGEPEIGRIAFFSDTSLDQELPFVNQAFWSALIEHVELDALISPRSILDVGCHTGGLLQTLAHRFSGSALFGIDPMAAARLATAQRLKDLSSAVTLLDPSEWDRIPNQSIDLVTSHEVLYLEPDLRNFMARVRRVISPNGVVYLVLGCHAENPVWATWKKTLIADGHRVFDHLPLEIMRAASSEGFLPSVQPLRRCGWVTYDPARAEFQFPDVQMMLDHHYRHKLIFRMQVHHGRTTTS